MADHVDYTAQFSIPYTSLSVTPTAADENARITVNNVEVSSGNPSSAIPLGIGDNNINIVVTAEDGTTTKTYSVNAQRPNLIVFSDDTFITSDWNHTSYSRGTGGTQTYSQILSGGNTDSYLNIKDVVNIPTSSTNPATIWGIFLKIDSTYTPSISGPIESVDYSEDAIVFSGGFGDGQASHLVLKQGDNIYLYDQFFKTQFSEWTNLVESDLRADDFFLFDPDSWVTIADSNPDFSSSGGPITFGFYRWNQSKGGGYTITGGIDNWQVTVNFQ